MTNSLPTRGAGSPDVTRILLQWGGGDTAALDELMPLVFEELRQVAGRQLRRVGREHTLQPTGLVSELFLRLLQVKKHQWKSREEFFCCAGQVVRHLLVDYARSQQRLKRGGEYEKISLECLTGVPGAREVDLDTVVAVGEAVGSLGRIRPRAARLVDLRYYAGLTLAEAADVLKVSPETLKKDWGFAKLWLARELRSLKAK